MDVKIWCHGIVALLLACARLAPDATAQTVNPQVVSFLPSADHDAVDEQDVPLVSWYALQVHERGNPKPFLLLILGKAAPGADGRIEVGLSSLWQWPPVPGVVLEARIVAVGPGGSGESDPSNLFVFEPRPANDRNISPSVRVTAPGNGAKVALSPRVALRAIAADADGEIAAVSFYVDGDLICTAPNAPYAVWWTNVTTGTHTVAAVALDNDGAYTFSPSVSVTVTRTPPRPIPPGSRKAGAAKPRPPAKPRIPR